MRGEGIAGSHELNTIFTLSLLLTLPQKQLHVMYPGAHFKPGYSAHVYLSQISRSLTIKVAIKNLKVKVLLQLARLVCKILWQLQFVTQ